ncbi:hypothetical protein GALMADRAFT_141650 [Galerina marginata CBS 339.88]|uniref:Uncharacterized protein n=1 Tax=Galerina marginata (strain CBS 339.88) TaxID=685588 RepID=A0A067SSE1_GALM3|nr:hypothetical protein GALMADRAFT_141650 [Galerina marginata CBS 339.88]
MSFTAIPVPAATILVDDSNPNIQYGPGWVNSTSSLPEEDPSYPMYGTLHETVNTSELKFTFAGSSVWACGQLPEGATPLVSSQPSLWNCSVDDVRIETVHNGKFDDTLNTALCCTLLGLDAQVQHEIHISTSGSQERPILFDYLMYQTSIAVPAADLLFYAYDPMFNYSDGWERQNFSNFTTSEPSITTQAGANFTFDFYGASFSNRATVINPGSIGSSVLWFGFYNTTFAGYNPGKFSVLVDGDGATEEQGLEPAIAQMLEDRTEGQSMLFRTFALPRAQHVLTVSYEGSLATVASSKAVPLSLTYLVVRNGTANPDMSVTPSPTVLTTPSVTLTTSPTQNATTTGTRKAHLAIAIGCSSTAVLVLLILGILYRRRRMKKGNRASVESTTSSIEPFNHDPASVPANTHRKGQQLSEVQEQPIFEPAGVEAPPSYDTEPHVHDSRLNTEPIGIAL